MRYVSAITVRIGPTVQTAKNSAASRAERHCRQTLKAASATKIQNSISLPVELRSVVYGQEMGCSLIQSSAPAFSAPRDEETARCSHGMRIAIPAANAQAGRNTASGRDCASQSVARSSQPRHNASAAIRNIEVKLLATIAAVKSAIPT